VAKLAAARKRKREQVGKCEGRKSHREARPEVVALARKLRRKRSKGGKRSLRAVSKELASQGYLNERGRPYAAKSVASMLREVKLQRLSSCDLDGVSLLASNQLSPSAQA
jgi:hypothetical protein